MVAVGREVWCWWSWLSSGGGALRARVPASAHPRGAIPARRGVRGSRVDAIASPQHRARVVRGTWSRCVRADPFLRPSLAQCAVSNVALNMAPGQQTTMSCSVGATFTQNAVVSGEC